MAAHRLPVAVFRPYHLRKLAVVELRSRSGRMMVVAAELARPSLTVSMWYSPSAPKLDGVYMLVVEGDVAVTGTDEGSRNSTVDVEVVEAGTGFGLTSRSNLAQP